MTSMSLSTIGQTGAATAQTSTDRAKLEKAAKAFEAVFMRQLLGSMRQGGFGDELMSNSGVEQFQEMADARTADSLAERGSLGIADMLLAQLAPKAKATGAGATAEGKAE
jgi:peptidoglycan hydrolase FlgJ